MSASQEDQVLFIYGKSSAGEQAASQNATYTYFLISRQMAKDCTAGDIISHIRTAKRDGNIQGGTFEAPVSSYTPLSTIERIELLAIKAESASEQLRRSPTEPVPKSRATV